MMEYVSVKGLAKRFGATTVLQNLDFTIDRGELITLLGPAGCGKSTLLRTLAGLIAPDAGVITVAGRDIAELPPKERENTIILQSHALFPNMTVAENVAFALKAKKLPRPEIEERVQQMLRLLNLTEKAGNCPRHLSCGQQQRAILARALVREPQILLLDEPPAVHDATIRKILCAQIRELLKNLNITTILATADQEEALTVSDRIFLMEQGRFTQIGTPEEIYTRPRSEFVTRFIRNYNVLRKKELSGLAESKLAGELFAIRPESIAILPPDQRPESIEPEVSTCADATRPYDGSRPEGFYVEGMMMDTIVLGNIRRNFVRVEKRVLMVDQLNWNDVRPPKLGDSARVFIPYVGCLSINAAHLHLDKPA